jgi:HEAT repeat protein/ActR/RegA family two-component response regulator
VTGRTCRTFAVIAAVLMCVSTAMAATPQSIREEFARGIKAFEAGRTEEAMKSFEKILDAGVTADTALELREMMEVRTVVKMMVESTPKARKLMTRLLELAAEAEKERLKDQTQIDKLINQLGGSFEVRGEAYVRLTSAGRYAVPGLVKRLANKAASDYAKFHVHVTVALIGIGDEAVLPLCTALRADAEWLRQDVCYILGEIGDPRSAPYLLRAAKNDPSKAVRTVALAAIKRMRRDADVSDDGPAVALFKLARLYYYKSVSVQRSSRFGYGMWTWSKTDGLVMEDVPAFLYNISMARKIASEALLADPDYEPTLPLLISAYYKEVLEIGRRLAENQEPGGRKLTELVEGQIRSRQTKAQGVLLTLQSAGEKHFYRALAMQLRDAQPQLAVAAIESLATVASPNLNDYAALPALSASRKPAVLRSPVRVRDVAAAPAPMPTVAVSTADTTAVTTKRPTIDPMDIFGIKVEKEKKVARKATGAKPVARRTVKDATPAQLTTLNTLIARARLDAMTRRKAKAVVKAKTAKPAPEAGVTLSNPLTRAMKRADKGIRYGAAAALVQIGPTRSFAGSKAAVEIIGQAITEQGYSTVLIVSSDHEAANRLGKAMRDAGHVPSTVASAKDALVKAKMSFPPKDLILLQDSMLAAFDALKRDPALTGVPVVVFTKDKDTAAATKTYGDRAAAVVSMAGDTAPVKAAVAEAILGSGRTAAEGKRVSKRYARVGAEALDAIPASGSPFSKHLPAIKNALVAALDREDPVVRVSAIRALGKAKITSLIKRLIKICGSADRPAEERLACIQAIGDMMELGDEPMPEVVSLLQGIHRSGDKKLRKFAIKRLSNVLLPIRTVEQLVNEAEGKNVAP